jgi:tetratricopeptide (TPR) repeat protein
LLLLLCTHATLISFLTEQALEEVPGDVNVLLARAQCYIHLGQTGDALKDADVVLKKNPTFHKALLLKAEALFSSGKFEFSLIEFRRGLKLRPDVDGFRLGIQKCNMAIKQSIDQDELDQLFSPRDMKGRVVPSPARSSNPIQKKRWKKLQSTMSFSGLTTSGSSRQPLGASGEVGAPTLDSYAFPGGERESQTGVASAERPGTHHSGRRNMTAPAGASRRRRPPPSQTSPTDTTDTTDTTSGTPSKSAASGRRVVPPLGLSALTGASAAQSRTVSAATSRSSRRSERKLLGLLQDDLDFLRDLEKDSTLKEMMGKSTSQSQHIQTIVREGVAFLDKREDFWRQQEPPEAQRKGLRSSRMSSRRGLSIAPGSSRKSARSSRSAGHSRMVVTGSRTDRSTTTKPSSASSSRRLRHDSSAVDAAEVHQSGRDRKGRRKTSPPSTSQQDEPPMHDGSGDDDELAAIAAQLRMEDVENDEAAPGKMSVRDLEESRVQSGRTIGPSREGAVRGDRSKRTKRKKKRAGKQARGTTGIEGGGEGEGEGHEAGAEADEAARLRNMTAASRKKYLRQTRYAMETLERIHVAIDRGELESALKFSKNFLSRLATIDLPDKPRILGNLYSLMGVTYMELNKLTLAVIHHRKDLDIAMRCNFSDAYQRALENLGATYERMGDYSQAIRVWEKKLLVVTDSAEKGRLYDDIGRCHFQLNEFQNAIEYAKKALETCRETGDKERMISAKYTLGHGYCRLKEFEEAVPYFEGYLNLSRELGDAVAEANALTDLGNVYLELGDVTRSISYQQQAMALSSHL